MKSLLRSYVVHTVVLWIVAENIGGIQFTDDPKILLLGSLALTIVDTLIKPLLNILLLPFNLVTLGTFRWVSSALTLYLSTLLVPGFSVIAFVYPGFNSSFFIIPEITFSLLWAYIMLSVIISFIVSFIFWLMH